MTAEEQKEHQRKLNNRQHLADIMHNDFICQNKTCIGTQKRIFNCFVATNYQIDYETCCNEFGEFIKKEMMNHPLI